ncbi:SDR family NAD(P)-dependent oxidoreductase [Microbacterium sp.]|uniref:SDR family NAD(P)-dependent oxidoreductase n=1 Tax=Microbacterium sp. TaxID=51671 RepID=UPI0025FE2AB6|nr:SDR family oxidoreductase [Microbacterium sp.]
MTDDLAGLDGAFALVTGAGRGIGREIALSLARHGARAVAVNDYFADRAESVADEVRGFGIDAVALVGDVSDHGTALRLVDTAANAFGAVDILVNNAGNAGPLNGIGDRAPFWETGPDEWGPWLDTNLYGVLNCTRAVLPSMVESGSGRVVSVISDAGRVGEPDLAVYAAAKAGVAGFTRSIAKAVGRYGVTANCVACGYIDTPATSMLAQNPELLTRALRPYQIRRPGRPKDVAAAVTFLASPAASWITGQTYPVNGGYSMAQ